MSLFYLITGANATQVTLDYKLLSENPALAKTIVIGKIVKESSGKLFLIPEKGWTKHPIRIEVKQSGDDGLFYPSNEIVGEKYLLFMVNGKNKLSEDVEIHQLLKKSEVAIGKLALRKEFVGEMNLSWQYCKLDNECIQTKNLCGKPVGLNKEYQKIYLDFLASRKTKVDCSKDAPRKTEKSMGSKCIDFFCS